MQREHDGSHLNWDSKLIDSGRLQQSQTKLQFLWQISSVNIAITISLPLISLSFLGNYIQGERHKRTQALLVRCLSDQIMICSWKLKSLTQESLSSISLSLKIERKLEANMQKLIVENFQNYRSIFSTELTSWSKLPNIRIL